MKKKRTGHISKIMSKHHGIVTEIFFSKCRKNWKRAGCLNLINSRRPSFGDDINVTFIS